MKYSFLIVLLSWGGGMSGLFNGCSSPSYNHWMVSNYTDQSATITLKLTKNWTEQEFKQLFSNSRGWGGQQQTFRIMADTVSKFELNNDKAITPSHVRFDRKNKMCQITLEAHQKLILHSANSQVVFEPPFSAFEFKAQVCSEQINIVGKHLLYETLGQLQTKYFSHAMAGNTDHYILETALRCKE